MKTLLTLILACAIAYGHAQQVMRPVEQIQSLVQHQRAFRSFTLFAEQASFKDPALPGAVGLLLQQSILNDLLRSQAPYIEVGIPLPEGTLVLQLYRVQLMAASFQLGLAHPILGLTEPDEGLHYQGIIKGDESSIVALSCYPDEVAGLISAPRLGNLSLGKHQGKTPGLHALYAESKLPKRLDFQCHTPDGQRGYQAQELEDHAELRNGSNSCVNLYLEVDYDIFQDKGGLEATARYILAVFNEMAILYANERITLKVAQLYIWNTTSPYSSYDAYGLLSQFKDKRAGSIKGDVGMLISYKGGGGIAVVDGLCDPFNLAYVGIGKSFNPVPNYSFTVMVMTHELGHVLGAHHTHACVWNGNNTALDGCPGFTDGGCPTPPVPRQGGTIMSYCHITAFGINFSLGFGTQPGNLIRNRVANAPCMLGCGDNATPPEPSCGKLNLVINLDDYGNETTWEMLDATGSVVDRGGPYAIRSRGTKVEKQLCLPAGCYKLRILDSRGDGLCCRYGNGSFLLTDSEGETIAEGGQFTREAATSFCIDHLGRKKSETTNPPVADQGCTYLNFTNSKILSYGESQDQGRAALIEGGYGVDVANNGWKAIPFDYTITTNTLMEFEFRSNSKAEIHAIGLDSDLTLSTISTFQIWGTQAWGYQDYHNYPGNGSWRRYLIPVGEKFTGSAKYLFFACDNDAAPNIGHSQFRNVRIYEKNLNCARLENLSAATTGKVWVFPNPADDQVTIHLEGLPSGPYQLQLMDGLGRSLVKKEVQKSAADLNFVHPVADFAQGVYHYILHGQDQSFSGTFLVR